MPAPFRLICALLTLLLALPAMQANACAPAAVGHAMQATSMEAHGLHHGRQGDEPATPDTTQARHECLGCIPPIDISTYRAVERTGFAFDLDTNSTESPFSAGLSAPPEPPPPRTAV